MSKSFYMANKSLHTLPKFSTSSKGVLVGNGQNVPALFVIPIVLTVTGHCFGIYTIIGEIYDGIDLVFRMKNMVKTEGVLSARNGTFQFINRSVAVFSQTNLHITPKSKVDVKCLALFCEETSGMAVAKFGIWMG